VSIIFNETWARTINYVTRPNNSKLKYLFKFKRKIAKKHKKKKKKKMKGEGRREQLNENQSVVTSCHTCPSSSLFFLLSCSALC
jgi:hypothetical protein